MKVVLEGILDGDAKEIASFVLELQEKRHHGTKTCGDAITQTILNSVREVVQKATDDTEKAKS